MKLEFRFQVYGNNGARVRPLIQVLKTYATFTKNMLIYSKLLMLFLAKQVAVVRESHIRHVVHMFVCGKFDKWKP